VPTPNFLASDTILLTVCGKYRDLCCNCQRTLLIGPTTDQKDAYQFMLDLFDVALNQIKPGVALSQVYKATV